MKKEQVLSRVVLCAALAAVFAPAAVFAQTKATPPAPAAVPSPAPVPPPPAMKRPTPANGASDSGFFGKVSSFFSHKDEKPSGAVRSLPHDARMNGGAMPPAPPPMPPRMPGMMPFQRPNVSRKADSKNLEIARKIVALLGQNNPNRNPMMMRGPMMGITMSIVPMIDRENKGKEAEIQKIASGVMDKIAAQHSDDAEKDKAIAYAQIFTYPELEQLKSFYESDAGKKLIQSNNDLNAHEAMLSQDSAMSAAEEARTAMIKELKKNDIDIPKELEK
ncbi:MAG: DUF2059 domain-containing protein [Alphaproteobacteria bacterium]|nr:DUF2059 domain-containing protein [Alphaproteobacteria bacterium]